jgi:hypothetical protein
MILIISHATIIFADDTTSPIILDNLLIQNKRENVLISHVKDSVSKAYKESSKLTNKALLITGMSSPKVRHLLNNLCSLPGTNYLEIGVWQGSTWVSALFGNNASISSATAIDDWSEFSGSKNQFFANCKKFLPNFPCKFYSANCFDLDVESIISKPINIYFYDGNHTSCSHELAFTHYDSILDDVFIAVVDDWIWDKVQDGTRAAFQKLNYNVLYEIALATERTNDVDNWWNRLYVAVISKHKN